MTDKRSNSASGSVAASPSAFSPHAAPRAQAECLKKIREEAIYKTIGLTWEQFCKEYAGISRSYARRLDEFASAYFHLGVATLRRRSSAGESER